MTYSVKPRRMNRPVITSRDMARRAVQSAPADFGAVLAANPQIGTLMRAGAAVYYTITAGVYREAARPADLL